MVSTSLTVGKHIELHANACMQHLQDNTAYQYCEKTQRAVLSTYM